MSPAEGLLHSTSLHLPMAEGDAPLSAVDLDSLASTISQAYGLPAEDGPHLISNLLVDKLSRENVPVSHFSVRVCVCVCVCGHHIVIPKFFALLISDV